MNVAVHTAINVHHLRSSAGMFGSNLGTHVRVRRGITIRYVPYRNRGSGATEYQAGDRSLAGASGGTSRRCGHHFMPLRAEDSCTHAGSSDPRRNRRAQAAVLSRRAQPPAAAGRAHFVLKVLSLL